MGYMNTYTKNGKEGYFQCWKRVGGEPIKTLLESLRQKYTKEIVVYWDSRAAKGLVK